MDSHDLSAELEELVEFAIQYPDRAPGHGTELVSCTVGNLADTVPGFTITHPHGTFLVLVVQIGD